VSRPLLEARGIEKRFGAVAALSGIDLELETHRVVAIVGPNGAGKSTLLKLLAGLARPSAGRITRHGGAERRADVGYLGHATLLYPELTAAENLELAGRLHGVEDPGARARALLEREGMIDVADRRAGTFSRGMAQRLSIARALVHAPAVLLLDEPFTGLDLPAAERLAARLAELREEGHGLVLVTHDIVQAGQLADRVVVLRAGRVAFTAQGAELEGPGLARRYTEALAAGGAAA
jgi:heme exporter protein A